MLGLRRRKAVTFQKTSMIREQSMTRSSMTSTMRSKRSQEMSPTWLALVSFVALGKLENTKVDKPLGNHEANCDNGANLSLCLPGQMNFTGYRAHWNMPSDISGGLGNFWYSFDHGMAHFVMFNTETDFPNAPDEPGGQGVEDAGPFAPTGTQLAWLKNDLASVDRKKTPWVIAAGHRPWYVSTSEVSQ